jgi:hypothetical protein
MNSATPLGRRGNSFPKQLDRFLTKYVRMKSDSGSRAPQA